MPEVLRFGISSLDELFGEPTEKSRTDILPGIYLPDATNKDYEQNTKNTLDDKGVKSLADNAEGIFTTSVCIIGPTGTGKSIFALHMASTYLADCILEKSRKPRSTLEIPSVLYISTDLTYKMADRAWSNFALNYPRSRRDPFYPKTTSVKPESEKQILLKKCDPTGLAQDFEIIKREEGHVLFLDMAAYTAGDDWGFLHRVLSLLPTPKNGGETDPSPRHLVVIDAIEGFEALGGEVNAFGEKSTRRSRIAQMMRLVSGKCHAVLVVEQAKDTASHETLGEEFVADTVIRLDSISTRNYERRVLKVEKCRGQSHIRGQHHYSIRSGKGSTTGRQVNPDDPRVPAPGKEKSAKQTEKEEDEFRASRRKDSQSYVDRYNPNRKTDEDTSNTDGKEGKKPGKDLQWNQSYVQVFHSVHRISRKIMEDETDETDDRPGPPPLRYAAFGIKYLDNMLGGTDEITERIKDVDDFCYDTRGLPCSSTTALIGDSLTQKSTLGRAFLSRCFYSFDEKLHEIRDSLTRANDDRLIVDELWRDITRKVDLISEIASQETRKEESRFRRLLSTLSIAELVQVLEEIAGKNSIISKAARELNHDTDPYLFTNLAAWLLDHRGGVAVMLVTHNTDFELLAIDFKRWLYSDVKFQRSRSLVGYDDALTNYIKAGTICRRLEIHSLSSEVLVHIIRQAIYAAQRKTMTPLEMEGRQIRNGQSWPIRLVIDDFSSLRNIFPELREDPLLFPSILFHLEREGVTTLIIDTQAGKPETTIAERFETELRQMVHHRLYTWRVPFYGESRVAIAAIPPLSHEYAGIVRELRWETERIPSDRGEPATVDPHFELYSGLEDGKPEPVPLHARFYAETQAMEEYIELENQFLGEMFSAYHHPAHKAPHAIILGMTPVDYGELRALAYLQRDTRLEYTFLFQVDEFWSMRAPGRHKRAGAFQPQWSYLNAITATAVKPGPKTAQDYVANPHADPYELFLLRNQDPLPEEHGKILSNLRRRHFYEKYYEDFDGSFDEKDKDKPLIDRVPFSWDFGFLLCQEKAWKNNNRTLLESRYGDDLTVQRVWHSLIKAEYDDPSTGHSAAENEPLEYVSWRIFAEASKKAAEEQSAILSKPVTAFDFAQVSPESFSCLIFEIWLSEIYDCLIHQKEQAAPENQQIFAEKLDRMLNTLTKRQLFTPTKDKPGAITLSTLLDEYWLELYKSWLLLIEVLDLSKIIGDATLSTFDLRSTNTDFYSVASRHWYKTATQCPEEIARKEPLIPVRLPGRFSVRGDWFLAVSGGSRSIRQAERALDLLNSRRANVTRLQMGVGLPTRVPKSPGPNHGVLYTKLISHQGGQDSIEYDTFLKIAADRNKEFYWLWRSGLADYAPYNRVWHRWLNRTLLWWHRKLLRYRWAWRNSFHLHDVLTNNPPKTESEFAPTRKELREIQGKLRKASSSKKKKLREEFFKKYPETHSFAQLNIRVEFLELLNMVKEEIQNVALSRPE